MKVTSVESISLDVDNYPISQLFQYAAQELKIKYVLLDPLKGNVSLHLKDINWNDFLYHLFKGGECIYKYQGEICYVGSRKNPELKSTKVLPLQFRSVDKLNEVFPSDLVKGIELKVFDELNSFVAQGDADRIQDFQQFLKKIDRLVPVVLIDVIIMEVTDTKGIETGIDAGLGRKTRRDRWNNSFGSGCNFKFILRLIIYWMI